MALSSADTSHSSTSRGSRDGGTVRSVDRALAILLSLGRRELTLTEISRALRLHKTTVTRLLGSLVAAHVVSRDEHGRYGVGVATVGVPTVVSSSSVMMPSWRSMVRLS